MTMRHSLAADWPVRRVDEVESWLGAGFVDDAGREPTISRQLVRKAYSLQSYRLANLDPEPELEPKRTSNKLDRAVREKIITSKFALFVFQILPTLCIAAAIVTLGLGYIALAEAAYGAVFAFFIVAAMALLMALAVTTAYDRMKREWRRRLSAR